MGESLRSKLQEDRDWELAEIAPDAKLPEALVKFAVELARGEPYTELRIIPSEDAMREEPWELAGHSHFIYGKKSEARKAEDYIWMGPLIEVRHKEKGYTDYIDFR